MNANKRPVRLFANTVVVIVLAVLLAVIVGAILAGCGDDDVTVTTVPATAPVVVPCPVVPCPVVPCPVYPVVVGQVTEIHRIGGGRLVLEVQASDDLYIVEVRNTSQDHAQSVALLRPYLRVGTDVSFPWDLWPENPDKESCLGAGPVFCRINADSLQLLPAQQG